MCCDPPAADRLPAAVFSSQEVDWPATVRSCVPDPLPAGLVVARLEAGGVILRGGPAPYVLEGGSAAVAVLLDSALPEATRVEVGGAPVPVEAGGGGGARAGRGAGGPRWRLRPRRPSRWSVVDDRGGAWFPDDRLPKWDFHERPFFHGHDLVLDVPAAPLTVGCGRGL